MNYTEEFKQKLQEVYPSYLAWHRLAEEGNYSLIKELIDFDIGIITPDEILVYFSQGIEGLSNLQVRAKRMAKQNEVWNMAMDIYFLYDS
jgi:hypothetical protein